jgi:hypothetical protein
VPAIGDAERLQTQARPLDAEIVPAKRDVLIGPQPSRDLEELSRPRVPLRLVALRVAVGREVVLAAHDVDEQPPAGDVVERGGGTGEVRGCQ